MPFGERKKRAKEYETYTARFEPQDMEELRTYSEAKKLDMIDVIRDGVKNIIHGTPGAQFLGEPSIGVPVLGSSFGGPWDEIILDQHSAVTLTESCARILNAEEGDRFVQVSGDSMAEAGIVSGAYVLMSYLGKREPRKYDIVLVQIADENGNYDTTIKRWMGRDGQGRPRLLDGMDNEFELPEGTVTAEPVMVAKGAITSF